MQRPADLADNLRLGGVVDLSGHDRRVEEHCRVAVQERAERFAEAKGCRALGTAVHDRLQRVGSLDARRIVHDRVPLVIEDATAQGSEMQQERMTGMVTGCCARREAAHARLQIGNPARNVEKLVVGLGHRKAMLVKDVRTIAEDRGLGAVGNAEQGARLSFEIALVPAGEADVVDVAVDQVVRVIGRIRKLRVHEVPRQVLKLVCIDIVRLREDDVGNEVVLALVLRQFKRLALAHLQVRQLIHFDLYPGLCRELRQYPHHRVKVGMGGKVHDQGLALILVIRAC